MPTSIGQRYVVLYVEVRNQKKQLLMEKWLVRKSLRQLLKDGLVKQCWLEQRGVTYWTSGNHTYDCNLAILTALSIQVTRQYQSGKNGIEDNLVKRNNNI